MWNEESDDGDLLSLEAERGPLAIEAERGALRLTVPRRRLPGSDGVPLFLGGLPLRLGGVTLRLGRVLGA